MLIYPPYIDGIIPAFVQNNSLLVPFQMNPGVHQNDFDEFVLRVKNNNSQQIFRTLTSDKVDGNIITFSTNGEGFLANQYYKIQLAYHSKKDGTTSPYSTVGVVKCIKAPVCHLYSYGNTLIFNYPSTQNDETLYKYRLLVYANKELVVDEEVIANGADNYFHTVWFEPNISYEFCVNYTTINLYNTSTELDSKTLTEYVSNNIPNYQAIINYDKGCVNIQVLDISAGYYQIYRQSGKTPWELLTCLKIENDTLIYEDNTVEHGVLYNYKITQTTIDNSISTPICDIAIKEPAYFEDMFLSDEDKVLKIRFNPKMSSLKNTILETKTDTIGGQYPFFFRNGTVKYKEFPISGLISYLQDEEERFISKEELGLENDITLRTATQHNFAAAAYNAPTTSLKDYNIAAERKFKMAVLDWLNNGQPKLLKTPTEGTFIVRLMNVSLTPNEQLGRMLHEFSATAYEIADFNLNNCSLLNINHNNYTENLKDIISGNKVIYSQNLGNLNLTKNLILYNVFDIEFSGVEGDITLQDISGKEQVIQLNKEAIALNGFFSKIIIPNTIKQGNIVYTALAQFKQYTLIAKGPFESTESVIYNAKDYGDYIAEIEITGLGSDSNYKLEDDDIAKFIETNTIYLTNLNIASFEATNCKVTYKVAKEDALTVKTSISDGALYAIYNGGKI